MFIQEDSYSSQNVFSEIFNDLEKFFIVFNEFVETYFFYLKFILVFIFLSLGISTLMKLRGIYFMNRVKKIDVDEDPIIKERLSVGILYISLGLGILFNYLIYFLIWILDPLPERFVFRFINFHGRIDPEFMNRIENIEASKYPIEKSIYYCVAFLSFIALMHLVISIWLLLHNRTLEKIRKTYMWLVSSLLECVFFGFTTCLPLFL